MMKRIAKSFAYKFVFNRFPYTYFYGKWVRYKAASLAKSPPHNVLIESTNGCNANCVMCPRARLTRDIGIMDFDLFRKIIKDCHELGVKMVSLHNFGEPLLDPKLVDKVKYARQFIPVVQFYTNGSLLNEEKAGALLDAGLNRIFFSLDAATKGTYEKIRRGLDFDAVENNIINLLRLRKELNKPVKVFLNFTESPENIEEREIFIRKWKGKVDGVSIVATENWGGNVSLMFHNYGLPRRRWPCSMLWSGLAVNYDGKVHLCCFDYDGKVVIGDLKKQSLKEVWVGDELKNLRALHLRGDTNDIPLCNVCSRPYHEFFYWCLKW